MSNHQNKDGTSAEWGIQGQVTCPLQLDFPAGVVKERKPFAFCFLRSLTCIYFLVERQATGTRGLGLFPGATACWMSAIFSPRRTQMILGLLPLPVFPATHRPELHQGCWPQSGLTWICLSPWSQNFWLMKADPWWIVRSHYLPAPSLFCW